MKQSVLWLKLQKIKQDLRYKSELKAKIYENWNDFTSQQCKTQPNSNSHD